MTGREPHALTYVVDPAELVPELRAVKEYWDGKRGARAMARRGDIDPVELRSHLSCLSLVDVLEGGRDYRFRLLGTEFSRLFGRDSTGKTIREVYGGGDPEILSWMLGSYDGVLRSKRPVLRRGSVRAVDKDFIAIDGLLLPLSEDGERVSMIFGHAAFRIEK